MTQLFANNASSTLAIGIDTIVTSITVATATGTLFPIIDPSDPDNFFMLTLEDASSNIEVVKCTFHAAGSDTLTVTRAQENTTALAFLTDDRIELRITKGTLEGMMQKANGDILDQGTF